MPNHAIISPFKQYAPLHDAIPVFFPFLFDAKVYYVKTKSLSTLSPIPGVLQLPQFHRHLSPPRRSQHPRTRRSSRRRHRHRHRTRRIRPRLRYHLRPRSRRAALAPKLMLVRDGPRADAAAHLAVQVVRGVAGVLGVQVRQRVRVRRRGRGALLLLVGGRDETVEHLAGLGGVEGGRKARGWDCGGAAGAGGRREDDLRG